MGKPLIYIVEDDEDIRELIAYTLNTEYETETFGDGEGCLKAVGARLPEVIILDLMLPGISGTNVLKTVREKYRNVNIKIIILTAKATEINKVQGLDAGADDYITKPFSVLELAARVKANLRKYSAEVAEGALVFSGIKLDSARHYASADGIELNLTYKEFELLRELMRKAGTVLEREKLLTDIWGFDYLGESRTIDIHIKNLRAKLGRYGDCIVSVRGVGYSLKEDKKADGGDSAEMQRLLIKQKQEFFANASHELNTPLTSILGYSEIMLKSDKFERKFTEAINREAARMKLLIQDMLKISELEEHKDVEKTVLPLKEIAESILSSVAPRAAAKEITLKSDVDECKIYANREDLTELIGNLADNAVKYTNAGGEVTLSIKQANGEVKITVKDNGIGIPQKYQSRVFERFFRVDKGRSRAEGGTGLGLAIVKHIASRYGAALNLTSQEGAGTEISVTFAKAEGK